MAGFSVLHKNGIEHFEDGHQWKIGDHGELRVQRAREGMVITYRAYGADFWLGLQRDDDV